MKYVIKPALTNYNWWSIYPIDSHGKPYPYAIAVTRTRWGARREARLHAKRKPISEIYEVD